VSQFRQTSVKFHSKESGTYS